MELENHLFGKQNHLNQSLHFWLPTNLHFQGYILRKAPIYPRPENALSIFFFVASKADLKEALLSLQKLRAASEVKVSHDPRGREDSSGPVGFPKKETEGQHTSKSRSGSLRVCCCCCCCCSCRLMDR